MHLRITSIAPDGKLTLSPHEKAYLQMDRDAKLVMDTIDSYDGCLPFNDKARPEIIDRELGISKNAFKRAVGRL
jgi:predicted RNA-binding protein (virulence factor B family)